MNEKALFIRTGSIVLWMMPPASTSMADTHQPLRPPSTEARGPTPKGFKVSNHSFAFYLN